MVVMLRTMEEKDGGGGSQSRGGVAHRVGEGGPVSEGTRIQGH